MPVLSQELAIEQFEALEPDAKLIILQPNFVQQHTALGAILREPDSVYVRLDGNNLSAEEVHRLIEQSCASQAGGLASVSTLVLDEFDRVDPASLETYLPELIFKHMNGRVVLVGRQVPKVALDDERLRSHTRFIPAERTLMLWDYARHNAEGKTLLEVRALGAGRVQLNGKPVDSWDGVLPRSLFFYLVDRGMTTRSDIFETFWPNLSTREATNVFHVTKRKISEVLGIDLTVYWSGFYHIAPEIELSYDAALFNEAVQESAVVSTDEAVVLLRRALALYRGDFLRSIEMPWVQRRREELRQTYGEALVALARSTERQGEMHRALGFYLRAATTNRQREDLAHHIMRLYRTLGMHQDALLVYDRLEQQLKNSLGVTPGPTLQGLAETIRAELAQNR